MYVVVRNYSGEGASELMDLLAQRSDEVRELITTVPGFVSYAAFRDSGGGATVTVCQDKAGTDESTSRAGNWVRENASGSLAAPAISEGEAFLNF